MDKALQAAIEARQWLELALRVLTACNERRRPAMSDIACLEAAYPTLAHLPVDELACQAVDDLTPRVFPRTDAIAPLVRTTSAAA